MTILVLSSAPSKQVYEELAKTINTSSDMPDGLILHAATESEDGSVQVVDVWESREEADQYERERVAPAVALVELSNGPIQLPPAKYVEPFDVILP
jgi:uncharacterized protein YeaC (DUF1315 family)